MSLENSEIQKVIRSEIKQKIDQIEKNYCIYKEVDFSREVDKLNSSYYLLDKKTGDLIYIYEQSKYLLEYDGYFIQEPNKNITETCIYISDYIFEFNDIIHIKFKYEFLDNNLSCPFVVSLINYPNIEFLEKFIKKNFFDKQLFKKEKCINFQLKGNEFISNIADESSDRNFYSFRTKILPTKLINCFVDLYNNNIYLNEKVYKINYSIHFKEELKYLMLNYPSDSIDKDSIIIAKRSGFIYLKPYIIPKGVKVCLKAIYKGNIDIQIYSYRGKSWLSINNTYICENGDIKIRIKMHSFDKLIKIFLIKI